MTILVVSCGDPSGIGPRMAAEVLAQPFASDWQVMLTGPANLWRSLGVKEGPRRQLIDPDEPLTRPGEPCLAGAKIQVNSLQKSLDLIDAGQGKALVTLPVNKQQLKIAGLPFAGHTELFRLRYSPCKLTMCFHAPGRWLALATDHIPLHQVAGRIDVGLIQRSARALYAASGLPVAICGLNPHAGEDGLLGDEEMVWGEALETLRAEGIPCRGFLPADGLFARWRRDEAILALYHDQGLTAFKALTANKACQISLGLPFIRTSPDHGTAYDCAKNGEGNPGSTRVAFETALQLASG
jgi:4-hydroxythreonine-4-phosphate dehydrogenase